MSKNAKIIDNQNWLQKDVCGIEHYIEEYAVINEDSVYIPYNYVQIHRKFLKDKKGKTPTKEEYAIILSNELGRNVQLNEHGMNIDLNYKNYRKLKNKCVLRMLLIIALLLFATHFIYSSMYYHCKAIVSKNIVMVIASPVIIYVWAYDIYLISQMPLFLTYKLYHRFNIRKG